MTVSAPARLTIALLGLSLAACTSGKETRAKPEGTPSKSEAPEVTPDAPKPVDEPTTAIEPPEPPIEPPIEPPPPDEVDNVGTTDGSTVEPKPALKTKYGGPRPAKKYGAPPTPSDGPF